MKGIKVNPLVISCCLDTLDEGLDAVIVLVVVEVFVVVMVVVVVVVIVVVVVVVVVLPPLPQPENSLRWKGSGRVFLHPPTHPSTHSPS